MPAPTTPTLEELDGVSVLTSNGKRAEIVAAMSKAGYNLVESEAAWNLRFMPAKQIIPTGTLGIDVSLWQGAVDWEKMKGNPNASFVFVKATQGDALVDPQFASNWRGLSQAGIMAGTYHFFDWNVAGEIQAKHYWQTINGDLGQLGLAIDVEGSELTPEQKVVSTRNLKDLLDWLTVASGRFPMIYTSREQWRRYTTLPTWAGNYPLWVAQYNEVITQPSLLPQGWSTYRVWQYKVSADPVLPGVPLDNGRVRKVDRNKWGPG